MAKHESQAERVMRTPISPTAWVEVWAEEGGVTPAALDVLRAYIDLWAESLRIRAEYAEGEPEPQVPGEE